jgi:hypothetical protein
VREAFARILADRRASGDASTSDDDDDDDGPRSALDARRDGDDASESEIPPLRERLKRGRDAATTGDARSSATRRATRRAATDSEVANALAAWLRADDETYERALLTRGVDVDDALARARVAGVRASRAVFVEWLEGEGVALAHTKTRRARERRRRARVGAPSR